MTTHPPGASTRSHFSRKSLDVRCEGTSPAPSKASRNTTDASGASPRSTARAAFSMNSPASPMHNPTPGGRFPGTGLSPHGPRSLGGFSPWKPRTASATTGSISHTSTTAVGNLRAMNAGNAPDPSPTHTTRPPRFVRSRCSSSLHIAAAAAAMARR